LEVLRRGPRAWNEWRAQNPDIIPNLTDIALALSERQMGPINGGPVNFRQVRLRRAFLRSATLSAANLEWADLSDADLREARLNDASLVGADLTDAMLDHADFSGADLSRANLSAASLHGARNLTQQQIELALGDDHTVLPANLVRPAAWANRQTVISPQPVITSPQPLGRHAYEPPVPEPREIVPPEARRVSWLVGGPKRGGAPANAITPLRSSRHD
jgi:hypothetical protein